MRMIILAAMLLVAPMALADEQPITPSEFRAYAEGWTLYFQRDGEDFGSETFEPGGKTQWRYKDGTCVRGAWRPHGAQLCFLYDAPQGVDGEVLCWRMLRNKGGGMVARLLSGQNAGMELQITRRDKEPLLCGTDGAQT